MGKIVIDQVTGIKRKEGWKVTTNFQNLGLETVAAAIANAEGTTPSQARKKLEDAKRRSRGKPGGAD